MALRLLGEPPIDLHAGGIDLIFPHHENEIAQSEGARRKRFSQFWVHVEHLMVEGQKMSKSLGNQYTLRDLLDRGFRASAVRYLLLSASYRKQLNFTWAGLAQAEESVRRLVDFLARLDSEVDNGQHAEIAARVEEARREFSAAMDDDLNTARALAAVFELARVANTALDERRLGAQDMLAIRRVVEHFDRVLGVLSLRQREDAIPPLPPGEIELLIEERRQARSRRDFATADRIRHELAERGVLLEDTPAGVRWKRK
jgi:cysteinyl-tRNA synthetase